MVRHICAVASEHGIESPRGPWLPELPEELTLEQLGVPGGFDGTQWGARPHWLTVPIGMYDAPREQRQGVQLLDLAANGHCGFFSGAPGTGKTTLLKSWRWPSERIIHPRTSICISLTSAAGG